MVFDLKILHILHIIDIGGRNDYIAGGAAHVGQPFEHTGVVQRNDPYQLVIDHLNHWFADVYLAAQAGFFTQFFIGQLDG